MVLPSLVWTRRRACIPPPFSGVGIGRRTPHLGFRNPDSCHPPTPTSQFLNSSFIDWEEMRIGVNKAIHVACWALSLKCGVPFYTQRPATPVHKYFLFSPSSKPSIFFSTHPPDFLKSSQTFPVYGGQGSSALLCSLSPMKHVYGTYNLVVLAHQPKCRIAEQKPYCAHFIPYCA